MMDQQTKMTIPGATLLTRLKSTLLLHKETGKHMFLYIDTFMFFKARVFT